MSYENTKKDVEILIDGGLDGKFVFNTMNIIGHGNFGKIFKGRSLYTYEEVAIKLEPIRSMHLLKEYYYYKILGASRKSLVKFLKRYHNIQGLLEVYLLRNIELEYMAMVMELMGPSLFELFTSRGNKFSLKTVLMISIQMISRIEYVHKCNLIHRDIRPENLLVGRPHQSLPYKESTENTIYLIDFGMAKQYVNPMTGNHIPYTTEVGIFGTHRFMSAKSHLKIGQSRRDDLESLGYVLLYFVNGTLPWMKYLGEQLDVKKCGEMKSTILVKDLCAGLPEEFHKYFDYVKRLEYSETPDYEMLRTLFITAFELNEFPDDKLFDWSSV